MNNAFDRFISRLNRAEERTKELKDTCIETFQPETKKKKIKK